MYQSLMNRFMFDRVLVFATATGRSLPKEVPF
jgi:hypothetical protein